MSTLGMLADLVDGEVIGDRDHCVSKIADLVSAGPADLSFFANPKYRAQFDTTQAGCVLVASDAADKPRTNLIVCDNPYLSMAKIATEIYRPDASTGGIEAAAQVHATAKVDPSATVRAGAVVDANGQVGPRSSVAPTAYVGVDAVVGADCVLHPGAKVLDRCQLGNGVVLQAGAVVGSDGFGYAPTADGKRHKIPQVGDVVLEDDVEVGANTTIDRGTFGTTRIRRGTKIDNLVQIAHNVEVGEDCVVVSQSGVAGSTRLGNRVILGAQSGVVGHVKLVDDVVLSARGGAISDVSEPGIYSGMPALPHREWLRLKALVRQLPTLKRTVRSLGERLGRVLPTEADE